MEAPRWTLDELAERVDAALAVDYPGPASGRVRAVPDRRAIRWYTTIGLIDRPAAHRGRTALYGPRHLLQLVAVKRLQAKGMPLVAIQQELAGATDSQLAELARVAHLPAGSATPLAAAASASGSPSRPSTLDGARQARARRADFWREPPDALAAAAAPATPATADAPDLSVSPAPVSALNGVRLGEGATLLLEPGRKLDAADLHAILDAARPLLAVLRNRGLGQTAGNPGPGPDLRPKERP